MDRQTILLISDMRQVCLAEILTKKGHNVRCLDIRNRETALQQLEKLKRFLDKADVLILPIDRTLCEQPHCHELLRVICYP
jgi:dipicolinate synthase subunit A